MKGQSSPRLWAYMSLPITPSAEQHSLALNANSYPWLRMRFLTPLWHYYICISCCCSFKSDAIIARSEDSTPTDTEKARIRHMVGSLQQYKSSYLCFFSDFVHYLVTEGVFCGVWQAAVTLQWYNISRDSGNTIMHIKVINWEFTKSD